MDIKDIEIDHRAEAMSLLSDANEERFGLVDRGRIQQLQAEAFVHSNLAIAEGQERVAEALEQHVEDQRRWAGADPRWKS